MRRNSRISGIMAGVLALLAASGKAEAATLHCQHLPMLFQLFLRQHYSVKTLNDELKTRVVEQFIKGLDYSRTLLLESDVEKFRKQLPPVFDKMASGDCSLLDEPLKLIVERAKQDETAVREIVGPAYKLDETAEVNFDADKRGWPKTEAERKALLSKMVHFQMSNYLLADTKIAEAKKNLVHRYELVVKRLSEIREKSRQAEKLAEAFASAMDPHSSFLSQENLEDFQIQMRLSLEGIGASLTTTDGFTVIEELIPGGSADRMKVLKAKDKIIAVAQEKSKAVPVIDMDLKDVVKMIRGPKGTKVTLTILRQGEKTETFDVVITRDKIDLQEAAAKVTYQTRPAGNGKEVKIAVIDLKSFYGSSEKGGRSSYADVKKVLEEARKAKADAVVLNLAQNGGGLLEDAVRISGLFIRQGGVVATKDTEKRVEVLADEDSSTLFPGPVVVLTSRFSASASEILAGALKDYHRAIVVGSDHTFGKGTVQVLQGLPAGLGAMKVTTGMFFLPGGKSTQHSGVVADIDVPNPNTVEDAGEKTLDYSLPPQAIPPFVSKEAQAKEPENAWAPVDESLIKKLAEKSRERVAKDARFTEIKKELEDAAKNRGVVKLADIRKKAKKTETTRKEREKKLKDLEAPFIDEGVNIAADWVAMKGQAQGVAQR